MFNKGCRGSTSAHTRDCNLLLFLLLPTHEQHVCKYTVSTAAANPAAVTGENWFEVSNLLKIHILEAVDVQSPESDSRITTAGFNIICSQSNLKEELRLKLKVLA